MKRNDLRLTPAAIVAGLNGDIDNFFAAATPGGVEAQEKAGQTTFVHSATLPKECLYCTREQLEAMGIKFGPDADDLFVNVTLPDGWQKKATGHSMWSDLVDAKGRKRASIFYKAAFYDRKASISLCQRYGEDHYVACDKDGNLTDQQGAASHYKTVVTDCGAPVHQIGIYESRDYTASDEQVKAAHAWLDQHHPDWKNPLAYWG